MIHKVLIYGLFGIVLSHLTACGGGGSNASTATITTDIIDTLPTAIEPSLPIIQAIDLTLQALIMDNGLTGNPAQGRDLAQISDSLAILGKQLFFSKALSGDTDTACASCHHPLLGMADGLPLSVGVGASRPNLLGVGRVHAAEAVDFDGGANVTRNAPSLFNVALWDDVLFHDGRIESVGKTAKAGGNDQQGIRTPASLFKVADPQATRGLIHAQNLFPMTALEEMRGFSFAPDLGRTDYRVALAERLSSQVIPNTWLAEFQAAFATQADNILDFEHISLALEAYQQSLVFIQSPWQAYVQGDISALSAAAKRGAVVFYQASAQGGAACGSCHAGDFFTDEQFHVLASPQLGRGRLDGATEDDDFGRFQSTGIDNDKHAFRTPTLLNVTVTAPYGHAGAHVDLKSIILQHLNVEKAVADYDYTAPDLKRLQAGLQTDNAQANTQNALASLLALRAQGIETIENIDLTTEQVDDLIQFLSALTDPCVLSQACLSPWLLDNTGLGVDSLQLNAVNAAGDFLSLIKDI